MSIYSKHQNLKFEYILSGNEICGKVIDSKGNELESGFYRTDDAVEAAKRAFHNYGDCLDIRVKDNQNQDNRFRNRTPEELRICSENMFSPIDNHFQGFNFDPSEWAEAAHELIAEIEFRGGFKSDDK